MKLRHFTFLLVIAMAFFTYAPQVVFADVQGDICENLPGDLKEDCLQDSDSSLRSVVDTVVDVLSWIVGALSVLAIIIAGFMYVVSAGNPDAAKRAKNAILYALVGVAVALTAQIIVRFVLSSV